MPNATTQTGHFPALRALPLGGSLTATFRSGMSSLSDLRGAMEANADVGVVAGNLTAVQKYLAIPHYLDQGGKVFVDSGAFGAFQSGECMDWSKVLNVYECIAEGTDAPENLWVVSPDKIGDQDQTLVLVAEWKARILGLIDLGCHVIVPIQCGVLPGQAMIDAVASILGTHAWVAGIPSNKEAMSVAECATLDHAAFHILGRVQVDQAQFDRVSALRACNPDALITADANWMRSRLTTILAMTSDECDARRGRELTPIEEIDHPRAFAIARAIRDDQEWGVLNICAEAL